jgi:hypothetical protein
MSEIPNKRGTKTNHNWMEVDIRRGKITTVGDPAIKTLFAVAAVAVFYLFFEAMSVWGVAKLLLP